MLPELGKLIREKRQKLGWTIEELAEKSKSSPSLISLIERGKLDNIKVNKLSDIAEALDMSLGNFFIDKRLRDTATLDLINYLASLPEDKRKETANLIMKIINL